MRDGTRRPSLLRSDEEELSRAARVLRDGTGFFLIVCAPDLRPAARASLAAGGARVGTATVLRSGGDVVEVLGEEAGQGRIRSLEMGADGREILEAFNWHREKLLRGAAVVLWLDDLTALGRFHETAPDAYAFRDGVVLVRGDGGALPELAAEEPPELVTARKRWKRAKTPEQRGWAAVELAEQLRMTGRYSEAEALLERGSREINGEGIERGIRSWGYGNCPVPLGASYLLLSSL